MRDCTRQMKTADQSGCELQNETVGGGAADQANIELQCTDVRRATFRSADQASRDLQNRLVGGGAADQSQDELQTMIVRRANSFRSADQNGYELQIRSVGGGAADHLAIELQPRNVRRANSYQGGNDGTHDACERTKDCIRGVGTRASGATSNCCAANASAMAGACD